MNRGRLPRRRGDTKPPTVRLFDRAGTGVEKTERIHPSTWRRTCNASFQVDVEVSGSRFPDGAPTPEEPDPRLRLADIWPDDRIDPDRPSARLMSAGKVHKPVSERPQCSYCAGELVRSRMRLYERFLTIFTKRRPYRCLDCLSRRWR
jgi:hypothetical protein